MKRFLLLYSGPPAPPDATHEGWREWFAKIGDALVDLGSPMKTASSCTTTDRRTTMRPA
jgi:hypothetical protein